MVKEGAMKYGDIMMLWGVVLTMMGILSVIQMGIMDGLPGFVLTGIIFAVVGIVILVSLFLADMKKNRDSN